MRQTYSGLEKIIIPVVEGLGCEFVGSERVNQDQHQILRVYIDKPDGIKLEDCQKVSSQLDAVLDVEGNINEAYFLEVSSPGLDRKIFTVEQLEKQVGKKVKLKLNSGIDGRKKFSGVLKAINVKDSSCTLDIDGTDVIFILDTIDEARLVPEIKF